MLLTILFCAISAVLIILLILEARYNFMGSHTDILLFPTAFAISITLLLIVMRCASNEQSTIDSFMERYYSISYRIENNINTDSDELYQDIYEYNLDVLNGRKWQYNSWVGSIWVDVYDDLPLISGYYLED